ncbi:granulin a [Thalassophryne amazonica]|uniref:granulin a n=1 Tax=Thalassophryne amazonica TaxID=390379 RepID=UPI0014725EB1|nr:granulin a [Thalassophryne amazonica]
MQMLRRAVICCSLLVLVGAHDCPDGGRCKNGQTCCSDPANGYQCCPFHQAECCEDHVHCCPEGTNCDTLTSSCMNATVSMAWAQRSPAQQQQGLSKPFRMINSRDGSADDHMCPDGSRCPPEFSCLKALSKFICCPFAQGVACSDGKHCCLKGHRCSENSRSCIKKESASTVLCKDGVSECPIDTTCCQNPEGSWGCCPMPRAVCCADKMHCCREGTICDLEHLKCISSSTKEETPMWAKLAARRRAEWENQKNLLRAAAEDSDSEKVPERTTAKPLPYLSKKEFVSPVATAAAVHDVPCNETVGCPDDQTCCKNNKHGWTCCPLPEGVCCEDHVHCCPAGMICNLTAQTCDKPTGSTALKKKIPALTLGGRTAVEAAAEGLLAVMKQDRNRDHEEEVQAEEEKKKEDDGQIQCDSYTTCPPDTTCCFMASVQKWGCCILPNAVCCADGLHCCPAHYKCDLSTTSCFKGDVVIPWYTKVAATAAAPADVRSVPCDADKRCPEDASCCWLATGEWVCCPLSNAVCFPDKEHCCPQGHSCNTASGSCQKLTQQLQTSPLTPVFQPKPRPQLHRLKHTDIICDDQTKCKDDETCCKISATTWGCCPLPHAVCCSDMKYCCPAGYTCTGEGGCVQKRPFPFIMP